MLPNLQLEDVVRLRKPHPCGGFEWKVVRLGADIGLECLRCGRRTMLTRRELARRVKVVYSNPTIQTFVEGCTLSNELRSGACSVLPQNPDAPTVH